MTKFRYEQQVFKSLATNPPDPIKCMNHLGALGLAVENIGLFQEPSAVTAANGTAIPYQCVAIMYVQLYEGEWSDDMAIQIPEME